MDHHECVQVDLTVEQVSEHFRHHPHEFAAVVDGVRYVGLISRGHLGTLLGTRFGFTLHSRHQIREHILPGSLCASPSSPLLVLLERTLSRVGESFYQDVPMVGEDGRFLGIIPVPALVRAQSALVAHQFKLAEFRRNELQTKNQALFRSLHELRQSQGRYQTLFQHSPLAVALLQPDGRIEAHNAKLQTLLGAGEAWDGAGSNLADLMPPRQRAAFLDLLSLHDSDTSLQGHHAAEFTLQLPALGERLFKFHTSLVRETGQICAILHDITEQRALEGQMAINDKAALFESLVGGIAHELNNKLAPVLGFSELLMNRLEKMGGHDAMQNHCNAISQSAQEAVRIIRQLLQLSRPATMELVPTDLGAILDEVGSIMQFRLRAAEVGMQISLPSASALILADAAQIKQVLINLLINAIDAMEHAARKVLQVRVEAQGEWMAVSISDTGHGIPADKLSRIFDPFYTTKSEERGTGLGLSVCLGIIRQHRGEISVHSVPGEGSEFRVLLPRAKGVEALGGSALPPAKRPRVLSPVPTSLPPERRLTVLVIDDEEYITNLVQELLRSRLGWRVERVHDGRQAIQRLEHTPFDLVITDLRMPGLDGFAVLAWIRDFRAALLPKVVVITGDSGSQSLDQELLDIGVPALRKPFTPDELIAQCRSIFPVA
ncbi:ATP-binding protein [Geothrix limicola]|uniref:ATP-binding protein n=1 Tax=Geothrix limicola TaxID=2927978 RepID=UPI002555ED9C|nr:ATP-binding protein [Geothrix limicola]